MMIILFTIFSSIHSEKVPDIVFDNYIIDNANLLDDKELDDLGKKLKDIETQTSIQFFIAIFNSLDGQKIENFALELFNKTGIGYNIKNNGLLLLASKQDKALRISTGYCVSQ